MKKEKEKKNPKWGDEGKDLVFSFRVSAFGSVPSFLCEKLERGRCDRMDFRKG